MIVSQSTKVCGCIPPLTRQHQQLIGCPTTQFRYRSTAALVHPASLRSLVTVAVSANERLITTLVVHIKHSVACVSVCMSGHER